MAPDAPEREPEMQDTPPCHSPAQNDRRIFPPVILRLQSHFNGKITAMAPPKLLMGRSTIRPGPVYHGHGLALNLIAYRYSSSNHFSRPPLRTACRTSVPLFHPGCKLKLDERAKKEKQSFYLLR